MVALGASVASIYDPWAVQSRVGLTDARLALDSVLMPRPNLSYIDYRSGVMASGDTGGTGGSSHMAMRVKPGVGLAVTVEMGNCVINTPGQGAYMCALDSQKTLGLAGSSSTLNRIDLIIARVYDDLNSTIGSPSGVRKFAVEVWTGDAVSGTPQVPTPTPTQGWTPLASVAVNANASGVSTASITDLRGPGLVARGGMRALYGADARPGSAAMNEAGAYPGDQRWVHTSGFQHQVYYGSNPDPLLGGWRGARNGYYLQSWPPPGNLTQFSGLNTQRELCRVDIPYPGTPFSIQPMARGYLTMSKNCAAELKITMGSMTGNDVNWTRFDSYGADGDHIYTPNVAPRVYGHFTAGVTVVLSCIMKVVQDSASFFAYRGDDTIPGESGDVGKTLLHLLVLPSHTQPPVA